MGLTSVGKSSLLRKVTGLKIPVGKGITTADAAKIAIYIDEA